MNDVEFLKVYAENFADSAYEKAITKKLEECLPAMHECNKILGDAINDHSHEVFDKVIHRYHVFAKDLCNVIDVYYEFIETFAKNHNLGEKFIIQVGKKYYANVLPKFSKYTDEMEAVFGF